METYISKIISISSLTKDVLEIVFEKPENFDYIAGQYVQLVVPTEDGFVRRSYSLSSTPSERHLSFCIKVIPEGKGTQYLASCTPGDDIEYRGPVGHFVPQESKKHFFIATGVGISPMLGMIKALLEQDADTHIDLLFGLRFDEDLVYETLFSELKESHNDFNYEYTLSRPELWSGKKGRVTEHLPKDIEDKMFYLCGSREMVIDVRKKLLEKGVSPLNIKFEIF